MTAQSTPEPRELTAENIQELAYIANIIASEIHNGFEQNVRLAFRRALSAYEWAGNDARVRLPVIRKTTLRQIGAVAKAANILQVALNGLDDEASSCLALLMNTGRSYGFEGEDDQIRFAINDSALMGGHDQAVIDAAKKYLSDVEKASALAHIYEGRGVKASTLKELKIELGSAPQFDLTAFEFFVLDILSATANSLTLNKNTGGGTLVEFLQACAPFLPASFIPAHLPLSRLQQLKTHSARRSNGR